MRAKLGCIPCILKQAYNAAILSTDDPSVRRRIINDVMKALEETSLALSPAQESLPAYRIAAALSGNADPYRQRKREFNRILMSKYEELKRIVASTDDPLYAAVKLSIAGNMIDLGIGFKFSLDTDLHAALDLQLAIDDYGRLRRDLARARRVLLVADNAGEIVLDKLLIETMSVETVTVAVRPKPIINDATLEDAQEIALDRLARIITTGFAGLGAPPACVGDDFRRAWEEADVIVAKGQANIETLDEAEGNAFFLLMAKCDYVAEELAVSTGDIVLAHRSRLRLDG